MTEFTPPYAGNLSDGRVWEPLESTINLRRLANQLKVSPKQIKDFEAGFPQRLNLSNRDTVRFIRNYCKFTSQSAGYLIARWRAFDGSSRTKFENLYGLFYEHKQTIGAVVIFSLLIGLALYDQNDVVRVRTITVNEENAVPETTRVKTQGFSLKISGDCWIRITTGNGFELLDRLVTAGETLNFHSVDEYRVWLGDHRAVRLFWNGEPLSAENVDNRVPAVYFEIKTDQSPNRLAQVVNYKY